MVLNASDVQNQSNVILNVGKIVFDENLYVILHFLRY